MSYHDEIRHDYAAFIVKMYIFNVLILFKIGISIRRCQSVALLKHLEQK